MENDSCVAHAPITLLPSPIPKRLYQECLDIQPIISSLMLKIANDHAFIEETLVDIVKVDSFTKELLSVNHRVQKEGVAQPIVSCINRSDYMLDKYVERDLVSSKEIEALRMRHVEVNAIASAMAPHSVNTSRLHSYLMSKYKVKACEQFNPQVPENNSLNLIVQGLIDAFDAYNQPNSQILFVTEDRSYNFSDHMIIEQKLYEKRPDIRVVRRKFTILNGTIELGPNKELLLDNKSTIMKEIAVVYYRYGYDPSNYTSHLAWDTRLLIERSRSIKCPSINFHLSGVKKFQQVLNGKEQLERFLPSSDAEKLNQVFCKFWSIDPKSAIGQEGFELGLNSPQNLVLKPQREGGGHNIFGDDISPFLNSLASSDERYQYILMEMINSPKANNWLMLYDDDFSEKTDLSNSMDQLVSELGIYGSILADGSQELNNHSAGYLVRSKKFGVKEGGVASGHAGISSLVLIDDTKIGSEFQKIFV